MKLVARSGMATVVGLKTSGCLILQVGTRVCLCSKETQDFFHDLSFSGYANDNRTHFALWWRAFPRNVRILIDQWRQSPTFEFLTLKNSGNYKSRLRVFFVRSKDWSSSFRFALATENRSKRQTIAVSSEPKGTLWIYGDSLALRLHHSLLGQLLCTEVFLSCRYSYNWIYPLPGESEYVGKTQNDDLDFRPHLVLESIRNVLRNDDMQSGDSLLVLNLGLHFPIGINFTTYQKLITDVIKMLKHREQELGSKAKVIWKTMSAIHKENAGKPWNVTNWRFFTDQVKESSYLSSWSRTIIVIMIIIETSHDFHHITTIIIVMINITITMTTTKHSHV